MCDYVYEKRFLILRRLKHGFEYLEKYLKKEAVARWWPGSFLRIKCSWGKVKLRTTRVILVIYCGVFPTNFDVMDD